MSFSLVGIVLLLGFILSGCSAQRSQSNTSNYGPAEEAAIASDTPSLFHKSDTDEVMDYDPWEPLNEKTFSFNFNLLDHYALKPAAKVWVKAPEQVRHGLTNAFYNLAMPKRFINKVLQGRFPSAGEELARFVLNSTFGVAGLFDIASRLGLHKSEADTGETFATYGIKPGPYLVLPALPPLTVRDAIGYAADSFMDPLSYFVTPFLVDFGRSAASIINERANNMTLYDDVEDTSLDIYAAVRNGYLQRRRKAIADAICDRDRTWQFVSDEAQSAADYACASDR